MQADDKCRKYYKLSYLTTTTTIYYYIETYVSSIKKPEIMPTLEDTPPQGLAFAHLHPHPPKAENPHFALRYKKGL